MKSPVFINEKEFDLWTNQNDIACNMGMVAPRYYPAIVITDELNRPIEVVYYSEFQKARYQIIEEPVESHETRNNRKN